MNLENVYPTHDTTHCLFHFQSLYVYMNEDNIDNTQRNETRRDETRRDETKSETMCDVFTNQCETH